MAKLSVVIPTFNDSSNTYLIKNLEMISKFNDIEVIISDGGSSDNTLELCSMFKCKIIQKNTTSRAERINFGIKESSSNMILLVHPRSLLNKKGIEYLLTNADHLKWGGFRHSFDIHNLILNFTSWYSNSIRGKIKGILYLDHCIFLKKSMAESIGELPCVDIFEDTILSQKLLNMFGKPTILSHAIITSAIRFETNGVIRQSLINQFLKVKYFMGSNHHSMNEIYEKNTNLNSKYEEN